MGFVRENTHPLLLVLGTGRSDDAALCRRRTSRIKAVSIAKLVVLLDRLVDVLAPAK
jgi:hypothetical protein